MSGWLLLAPIALGHACLVVLAVNLIHGIGMDERRLSDLKPTIVATIGLATLVFLAAMLRTDWAAWPWPVRAYPLACLAVALVGLPVDLILRLLRRPPACVSGSCEPAPLVPPSEEHALIGEGKGAWWLRLPGNESLRPVRTDWEVRIAGLPPALDGLTLLHLTDLHLHTGFSRRFYEAMADRIAAVEADLVLFTGDLLDDVEALEWAGPVLSRFRGRLGQFAVIGNHDCRFGRRPSIDELAGAGFEVIEGAWATRQVEGATIALGGTSYPWGPLPDPEARPEADLSLLLSHSPDNFYRASRWGIDLVLSGHTHGGQYRLPVIGPVLLPSGYSRRFDIGFFQRGRTLMYVSRGLCAQDPLRINCPPEFSRMVLRPAAGVGPTDRADARREVAGPVGEEAVRV